MSVKKVKELKPNDVIYINIKQAVRVVERVFLGYSNAVEVKITELVLSMDGEPFDILTYWGHDILIPVIAQSTEVLNDN